VESGCSIAEEMQRQLARVEERLNTLLQAEAQGLLSFQSSRQLELATECAERDEDELRCAFEQHVAGCAVCRKGIAAVGKLASQQ